MRRLLPLVALLPAFPAWADDLRRSVAATFYWETQIGRVGRQDVGSNFGFRLDQERGAIGVRFSQKPLLDMKFKDRGIQSVAFRDFVLHQNQTGIEASTADVNWWIVGGLVVGAAVAITYEERRSKKQQPVQQVCTPTPLGCI